MRVRSKLDRFVLAKLAEKGLTPSPEADARTLIRRAYIDLIGLKPTYDEVEAYAADPSPDKYEKLVDRLLASPQYGERWARYWLDVVRYAEDNPGNITNPPYPHAWRYRDWVIESLNKDVPYDRFVKLQLAADLMPSTPRSDLRALGIIALGPQDHKDVRLSVDVVGTIQLNDWDERLDAVSRGLLGLSVACARCHDHKFDPIQQKDYYRLLSVFASTQRALRPFFDIDRDTETRFMWVYQRMFDLHYTANLLESDPGSKPEQAARQVKKFRDELAALQSEIDAMSKAHPEIAAYIKTVPYPGEKAPTGPKPVEPGPAEKKALPVDLVPVGERVRNAGGDGAPRKRIDPAAPFLNSVYDAGVWFNDAEPDLTFFDAKPGCRAISRCSRAATSTHRAIRRRGVFRSSSRKDPPTFTTAPGGSSWAKRSSPMPRRSARASSSTASGAGTSASTWSARRATSACRGSRRRIPSCSTTWPRDSSRTAGRSSGSIARSCCRRPTGNRAIRAPMPSSRSGESAGCGA